MRNVFLNGILNPPKGRKSLASQIGYCFVIILVVLVVVSIMISDAYTAILKQDRSDAIMSAAAVSALNCAHIPLQDGMTYAAPIPLYKKGEDVVPYTLNIYTKAGLNSFLLVYSSVPKKNPDEQIALEGAGEAYQSVTNEQKVIVTTRTDAKGKFLAGVAPIVSADGTVSGILELTMPISDFSFTDNGISLSWAFTIIAIAVALCMVYFETNRLLHTIFAQPDRQLPKIIRYGLSGCQSIAFFSTMACSMPPLVISSFILSNAPDFGNRVFQYLLIMLGEILFAAGFFGFKSLRVMMVRSLTTRVSLIVSVFSAFLLLLLSALLSNFIIFLCLILPSGFFLGMIFYFQREYRIYAGRLGYDDFSNKKILSTQYIGYVLGACVGAVMAGMLYERFGLVAVSVVCGILLLVVGIQALLFVQHCPPSAGSGLNLASFLYALSSNKSGSFVWSTIVTIGIQISFFFLFVPEFIRSLRMSIATVAFYYILFFFVGSVLMKALLMLLPVKINIHGKAVISAVLQIIGFLLLSLMPTAKILVLVIVFFAIAMSLQDFRQLDHYTEMLREDKHVMARDILESAIALGGILGAVVFGAVFLFDNLMIPLLFVTLIYGILLLVYPFSVLLFSQNHNKPNGKQTQYIPGSTDQPFQSNVTDDDVKIYSPGSAYSLPNTNMPGEFYEPTDRPWETGADQR